MSQQKEHLLTQENCPFFLAILKRQTAPWKFKERTKPKMEKIGKSSIAFTKTDSPSAYVSNGYPPMGLEKHEFDFQVLNS